MSTATTTGIREGYEEKYGFHDDEQHVFKSRRGLDRAIVEEISSMKGEPKWMRDYRVKALEIFEKKPMPTWGGNVQEIDFQNIYYYVGIDDARFKKPVIPGDQLELDVKVERMLRGIGKFSCVARVGTEVAAEATILLAMRPAAP